ncbi:ATP-grasp fold amidoligase family protein [Rhizobium sp. CAU 1783]
MTESAQRESFIIPGSLKSPLVTRLRNLLWRILSPLPDRPYLTLKYRVIKGEWPNLSDPKTFSEKVQARKLFDRNPLYATLVDKFEAKRHIAERVGDDHVLPAVWVGTDLKSVDWDAIAYPVVVKPTHASGLGRFLYSRADADRLLADDPGPAWLAVDHAHYNREWAYSQVPPRIVIEKMLLIDGAVPWDYRLFTFNGVVSHIMIDIREGEKGYSATYSADWQKLPFYDPDYYPLYPGNVPRPASLERMVALAEALGSNLDFARIDLYAGGDQIYVGEITLYPGGGFERFDPPEYDRIVGDRWKQRLFGA